MCFSDEQQIAKKQDKGASVLSLIADAMSDTVSIAARSNSIIAVPATTEGIRRVSAALGLRLKAARAHHRDTIREVWSRQLRAGAVDSPFGPGTPSSTVPWRRIVFAPPGAESIPTDAPADDCSTRVSRSEFPFSMTSIGRSFLVIRQHSSPWRDQLLVGTGEPASALTSLHDALWLLLGRDAVVNADRQPPPRHLLPVLERMAVGATDVAAQRSLELSSRTFSRRASELLARLGAQTRFQAGVEAVKRGWI